MLRTSAKSTNLFVHLLVNSTGIIPARHSWLTISAFRSSTGTNPVDLSWLTVSAIRPPTGQFQSVPFSRLSRHRIVHWSTPVCHLADYLSNSIPTGQSQFFIWLTVSALFFFFHWNNPSSSLADCLSTSFFNWSNSSLSLAADYLGLSFSTTFSFRTAHINVSSSLPLPSSS